MISKVLFESQKWGPVILRGHCVAKLVYISRLEETSDWVSIGRTNKANICVFTALLLQSIFTWEDTESVPTPCLLRVNTMFTKWEWKMLRKAFIINTYEMEKIFLIFQVRMTEVQLMKGFGCQWVCISLLTNRVRSVKGSLNVLPKFSSSPAIFEIL